MSPISDVRYTPDEPHDLATELTAVGLDAVKGDGRFPPGTRVLVMVDIPLGGDEWQGGMGAEGYDHDLAAIREAIERKANVIAIQQREQRKNNGGTA